jgi:hypothetical protein
MDSGFKDELLQSYSDDELATHIGAAPRLISNEPMSRIRILSPKLISKSCETRDAPDTLKAIDIACRLGIRVPAVKRTLRFASGEGTWTIMERVPGNTLEAEWSRLSWFTSIKLALKLRWFVRVLRSITSPTVGSLETGQCKSFFLEDKYGLPNHASPENITSFLKFWARFVSIRQEVKAVKQPRPEPKEEIPETPNLLFLTHHDLAPRNLMLDPAGGLWVLDWDLAGFYPVYFEYAAMHNFHVPSDWNLFSRWRWNLVSWFVAGRYEQELHLLQRIRSKFIRFSVGRRFELLQNGGPSGRPVS